MKLQQIKEATKPGTKKIDSIDDKVSLIKELNASASFMRPIKLPKLDRSMLNNAIEEAVARWNAAPKPDAHEVPFPYDSDFNIGTKVASITQAFTEKSRVLAGKTDLALIKDPKFAAYVNAVLAIKELAPEAELYGKFVYSMIISLWMLVRQLHRTDEFALSEDEAFVIKTVLIGLGVKNGMPT